MSKHFRTSAMPKWISILFRFINDRLFRRVFVDVCFLRVFETSRIFFVSVLCVSTRVWTRLYGRRRRGSFYFRLFRIIRFRNAKYDPLNENDGVRSNCFFEARKCPVNIVEQCKYNTTIFSKYARFAVGVLAVFSVSISRKKRSRTTGTFDVNSFLPKGKRSRGIIVVIVERSENEKTDRSTNEITGCVSFVLHGRRDVAVVADDENSKSVSRPSELRRPLDRARTGALWNARDIIS